MSHQVIQVHLLASPAPVSERTQEEKEYTVLEFSVVMKRHDYSTVPLHHLSYVDITWVTWLFYQGLLCRESKKSGVRPLVTSVCPSVRPSVRPVRPLKNGPKISMEMVPLIGETYFLGSKNGPKADILAKITKIGPKKYVSPLKGTILVVKTAPLRGHSAPRV